MSSDPPAAGASPPGADKGSAPPRRLFRLASGRLSWRAIALASVAGLVALGALSTLLWRRHTRERRGYEHTLEETLDKLVTAQEGFFYDSARYAPVMAALPSIKPAPDVHVRIVVATPRSWWGSATDDRLTGRTCYVWVGSAPELLPPEARAPQNETKPMCFAENGAGK